MGDYSKITQNIDGDTVRIDGRKTRIANVNTPESVHPDSSRNTPEGDAASDFAKLVLQRGDPVHATGEGQGIEGRDIRTVSRVIGGVEIDYGLMTLDQGFSDYYTKYGKHADPQKHQQYKQYFSKYAPYTYGEPTPEISRAELEEMNRLHKQFTEAQRAVENGAPREILDKATVDLYRDPARVVRYRQAIMDWNRPVTAEDADASKRFAYDYMMQDPVLRETYNRAVQLNNHQELGVYPERDPGFWKKIWANSQYNDIANYIDSKKLFEARRDKFDDDKIPQRELLNQVPEQFHEMVLTEYADHGARAALTLREQLLDDLQQNKIMENQAWYSALGYGGALTMLSPSSWVGGLLAVRGASALNTGLQLAVKANWIKAPAVLTEWFTGGLATEAVTLAPRLAADHTYTAKQYAFDTVLAGALSSALAGAGLYVAKPLYQKWKGKGRAPDEAGQGGAGQANGKNRPRGTRNASGDPEQAVRDSLQRAVQETEERAKTQKAAKALREISIVQPGEITTVTHAQFQTILPVLKRLYGKDTNLRKLVNSAAGMYKRLGRDQLVNSRRQMREKLAEMRTQEQTPALKKRTKELQEREEYLNQRVQHIDEALMPRIEKIYGDIVQIARFAPFGKPAKNLENAIKRVLYRQKVSAIKDPLFEIVTGRVSNRKGLLNDYLKHIEKLDIWDGEKSMPLSAGEFFQAWSHMLSVESTVGKAQQADAVFHLGSDLPRELAFVKDVVELNNMAHAEKDPEFTELVEMLNGFVDTRLRQMEERARVADLEPFHGDPTLRPENPDMPKYMDSTRRFEEAVPMTPVEIHARLKKSGLKRGSEEWKKYAKRLRGTKVPVSEEVQKVGQLRKFKTATVESQRQIKVDSVDATGAKERRVRTEYEDSAIQDLLPRKIKTSRTTRAFKTPTAENLDTLHETLQRALVRKKGWTAIKKFSSNKKQTKRVRRVVKRLRRKDQRVKLIQEIQARGNAIDIMDLLQASKTAEELTARQIQGRKDAALAKAAAERKVPREVRAPTEELERAQDKEITPGLQKEISQRQSDVAEAREKIEKLVHTQGPVRTWRETLEEIDHWTERMVVAERERGEYEQRLREFRERIAEPNPPALMRETDADHIDSGPRPPAQTAEERAAVEARVERAAVSAEGKRLERVGNAVADWVASGDDAAFKEHLKKPGVKGTTARTVTAWVKELTTRLGESKLATSRYIAANLLETGRGFGGSIKRKHTAALIGDSITRNAKAQFMGEYYRRVAQYAAEQGAGVLRRFKAANRAGAEDPITEQFNRDFFLYMEAQRAGRDMSVSEHVKKFADRWERGMEYMHNEALQAGVNGFTKKNRIKHYVMHIWPASKTRAAVEQYGKDEVLKALAGGYRNAINGGRNPMNQEQAQEAAERMLAWILRNPETDAADPFMPALDSRAQARKEIDTSFVTDAGLGVLDLLDTETAALGTKYAHRIGGLAGIARATGGKLASEADIKSLMRLMEEEAAELGVDPKKDLQLVKDTTAMLLGRPTRGGLATELRMLKAMAALTKMGKLGSAQLIETGQAINNAMLHTFSDRKTVKHIFKTAGESETDPSLWKDISSISGITDDIEFFDREGIHLDEAERRHTGNMRKLSLWIADKATIGSWKAEASRILGTSSGFNAIRKYQSRITQASFIVDVVKHFKDGSGKMSNARLADLGLTNTSGKNDALRREIMKHAKFTEDGTLLRLHPEKWNPDVRRELQYAMNRAEAQNVMRMLPGEQPAWMNKPLIALLMQFRAFPTGAMNKQLARAIMFADKEAATGVMLNAAFSGLIRYGQKAGLVFAGAALTGASIQEAWDETEKKASKVGDAYKYMATFGLYSDLYAFWQRSANTWMDGKAMTRALTGEVPVLDLIHDYMQASTGYDVTGEEVSQMDAAENLLVLGNTLYGELIRKTIKDNLK